MTFTIDFELFGSIKNGERKADNKAYSFKDLLYFSFYGIRSYFNEENVLEGFEIRYAPEYMDRNKRVRDLCEDMSDTVVEAGKEEQELQYGITYRFTQGGKETQIQLGRLSKVEWGKEMTVVLIFREEKWKVLRLIDYSANFFLGAENGENWYIKENGGDRSVNPEPVIIPLQ